MTWIRLIFLPLLAIGCGESVRDCAEVFDHPGAVRCRCNAVDVDPSTEAEWVYMGASVSAPRYSECDTGSNTCWKSEADCTCRYLFASDEEANAARAEVHRTGKMPEWARVAR